MNSAGTLMLLMSVLPGQQATWKTKERITEYFDALINKPKKWRSDWFIHIFSGRNAFLQFMNIINVLLKLEEIF